MCIAADKMDDNAAAGAPVLCQRGVRGTRMCCIVNKELRVLLYQVYHRTSIIVLRVAAQAYIRALLPLSIQHLSRSRGGTWLPSPIRDPGLGGAGLGSWGQGERRGRGPEAETRPPRRAGARAGDGARGGRDSLYLGRVNEGLCKGQ